MNTATTSRILDRQHRRRWDEDEVLTRAERRALSRSTPLTPADFRAPGRTHATARPAAGAR